ncbi:UNVERIFIED_CONTAM: drug/metabolite transporter (DMT)-like permease [Acetivibrio alkalicellulosi]
MKDKYGYMFLINTVILFSTYEVISKIIVGKVDPFQINFLRFFLGGVLLFIFALIKGNYKIQRKYIPVIGLLGFLNVVLSMNLLQLSLSTVEAKASLIAVIFSSNPIFVMIFSVIKDKEKFYGYKIIGLICGVFGIVIMSINELSIELTSIVSPLLALLSAILYGLYTVIGRKISLEIGSLKMNCYSFLIGSLMLLPFLLLFKVPVFSIESSAIIHTLYLAFFVTGLGYLTYFIGLSIVGSSRGSMVFFLKPVLASIFALIFLKEQTSIIFISGAVLVLLGVIIILYWDDIKSKFPDWAKNKYLNK